jgi:branched-chain amino acid transport system substrate-binding protein
VKIGLAAPFEGLDRSLGYEALAGVKLALDERNRAGGVGGYMVELVALNDFGEPEEARLQAREFAADPAVVGVVTGGSDVTAAASLPVYRERRLAVVVPWSVRPELADAGSGIVLAAADCQRAASVLADAVTEGGPERLVVVADGSGACSYPEAFTNRTGHAEMIPPPRPVTPEALNEWATYLVLSRVRPPDTVVLATGGSLAGELLLALSDLGWQGAAFGSASAGSVHLVQVAGESAAGFTFASPAPAGRDAAGGPGQPSTEASAALGPRAVLAYDAAQVLLDAIQLSIEQDGAPSRSGVSAALPRVRRDGWSGSIAFDAHGHRVDAPVWLYNIANNRYPGEVLASPRATGSH